MSDSTPSQPTTPVVIGGREQLAHLLAEASEIEHTLMCTYLYAAFSLKKPDAAELRPAESDAIARWRKSILAVATDEMVHLLLVANLSIAIGGRPHFGRPNFPVTPGAFPADLVARLAPFCRATLDHFIFLERPQGSQLADGEGFEPDQPYKREEAFHGVMPSIQDYATVGELYAAIRINLEHAAARLGEQVLFIGPVSSQVGPGVVQLQGVRVIHDLATALQAIDTIIEQGEGSPGDREDSHFHRFVSIREEYDALLAQNPDFQPAWPAAENPVMRRPPDPEDKVFVKDALAAQVLDLGNGVYALLLQLIVQSFGRTGKAIEAEQTRHVSAAISLMHVLADIASLLPALPARSDHERVHAGLTFTMIRNVEPLFFGTVEQTLIIERLEDLIAGAWAAARRLPAISSAARDLEKVVSDYAPDAR